MKELEKHRCSNCKRGESEGQQSLGCKILTLRNLLLLTKSSLSKSRFYHSDDIELFSTISTRHMRSDVDDQSQAMPEQKQPTDELYLPN